MQRRPDGYLETLQLRFIATDRESATFAREWQQPDLEAESLALLQYTSGSTGTPKGVMVNHGNIVSNLAAIALAIGRGMNDEASFTVSWLPLFHDMGLFGKVLLPIYVGFTSVLMEPAAFIQKPIRWLEAVTKYRAHACAAPDSAYDLCARKISAAAKANLDLSSWHFALNGSEPVRRSTIARFSNAFASCGFRAEAMRPVYGMAEATLFIAGQSPHARPLVEVFDADSLGKGVVSRTSSGRPHSLVSCGHTWAGHVLRIVNPETGLPCPPDQIGEVWVSGPSVGAGYWNRPEESERIFRARIPDSNALYLRTGDLGFVDGEDLFVTGRLKDLIIVAGRNHYPQDLERAAEESSSVLMPNASAAFSVEIENEERVVLACEVRREALRKLDVEAVAASVRRSLAQEYEVELHAMLLLKTATIPRTSSGKVQRSRIRLAYLSGEGLEIAGEWHKPVHAPSTQHDAKDVANWLIERVSHLAGIAPHKVDPREPFSSYGLDSKDAIALSGELQERLGRPLPPTLVYDFPSISLLARHLTGPRDEIAIHDGLFKENSRDIAIIGMGCRFPGALNPEEFWRLLREGRDAVAASNRRGDGLPKSGLLEQVDQFDADFFGINAREAETMDPQQRLLLEVAWETLENAGLSPSGLAGSNTAVVIGISNSDYARLAQGASAGTGPYVATGNSLSVAANRISYLLDLRGPSWVVDTACSSSLVAVHQACRALLRGECDAALAGGVNLILTPQLSLAFINSGMLAPDGQCKAFDAAANGYVRGEGAGIILLKRLADAARDGDTILAVIRGSSINQDGRSNGLTAPNGPAQQAVVLDALSNAGVHAREVSFVEAHGTGTPLGDPIELNSLVAVLNDARSSEDLCWIGSVKTNIGHLESAAGIASLIKTVLMLNRREIPPHLHYRSLNPHITLENTPFRIPERLTPWTAVDGSRIAGVSSFGFGGTNAHVILGEAPALADRPVSIERPVSIVTLSARTIEGVQALARSYVEFIDANPEVYLQDLAFTANVGRSHFAQRAAIVAASLEELKSKLTAIERNVFAKDTSPVVFYFTGNDEHCREAARELARTNVAFRDMINRQCEDLDLAPPDLLLSSFQHSFAQLWMSFGIMPRAVLSEGAGQRAASLFADSLALESLTAVGDDDQILEISPCSAGWRAMLEKLADFYVQGIPVDWAGFDRGYLGRRLALPTYPFERRRYWLVPSEDSHPLLGRRVEQLAHLPGTWAWESRLDGPATAFFNGHRVMGSTVLPYSAYVEMALSAASQIGSGRYSIVKDLALHSPLFLREYEPRAVQTVLSRQSGGQLSFAVYSRIGAPDAKWQMCASAEIHAGDRN
jgi:acyl-CoA synthetase (AMP-forming)/AMP-acid ligase II/3-oxoacyl-(acyl-carrier-protein) synthase/acyl carrier protein